MILCLCIFDSVLFDTKMHLKTWIDGLLPIFFQWGGMPVDIMPWAVDKTVQNTF